jgi:hypothetical protein
VRSPLPELEVGRTPSHSAGTDKRGLIYDCASQQAIQIAQHDAPIKNIRSVVIGSAPDSPLALM